MPDINICGENMKEILIALLLSYSNLSQQVDAPSPTSAPVEDVEIKKMEWNRYVSKNFTILSIDNQKGKELSETIDAFKTSADRKSTRLNSSHT